MYISFAWTTDVWKKGLKTATRRFWTDEYAEKWWCQVVKDGYKALAYDRSPRFKGKRIGTIVDVQQPFLQNLKYFTAADEIEEGHLWGTPEKYVEMMLSQGKGDCPYVIKFKPMPDEKPHIRSAQCEQITQMKIPATAGLIVRQRRM